MKQMEVTIMGQAYTLGAPDGGEQRMLRAVQRVDAAMCKIRDAGKVRARERIAVLAALNLAYEMTAPSSASLPAGTEAGPGEHDAALGQLLSRLDEALGQDGQLF